MYEAEKLLQELPAGSELIIHHVGSARSVHFGCIVWVGSFDDPDGKEGLAHIFEHLPFRGTQRYATKLALAEPVELIGGIMNAETGLLRTTFTVDVPTESATLGWNVLIELAQRPRLEASSLNAEREVIAAEIATISQKQSTKDLSRIWAALCGEQLGHKVPPIGNLASLNEITLNDVQRFFHTYYRTKPLSLVVVGNLSSLLGYRTKGEHKPQAELSAQAQRKVWVPTVSHDAIRWGSYELPVRAPLHLINGTFQGSTGNLDQSRIPTVLPIAVISANILVQRGLSSLCLQKLREERNLVYGTYWADTILDVNLGTWAMGSVLRNQTDVETFRTVLGDLLLDANNFSDHEVEKAKTSIIGRRNIQSRNLRSLRDCYLKHLETHRSIYNRDEWLRQITEVDTQDVRDFVTDCLHPSKWVEVTFLPK